MTRSEIARALEVPPKERSTMREAVKALEADGKLQRFKKSKYGLPREPKQSNQQLISGTIRFADPKRGRNAFLELDERSRKLLMKRGDYERLFVPARFTSTALPGDRVTAAYYEAPTPKWHKYIKGNKRKMIRPGENRLEARLTSVDVRARKRFVGTLRIDRGRFAHVEPDDATIPKNFDIRMHELPDGAKDEHRVLVEMLEWKSPFDPPSGRVVKILGNAGDAGVDILAIIHRYELPLEFPNAVLQAAEGVNETIDEAEIATREDWREELVYTIDPVDARDFDDAICVKRRDDGGWELAVFIADVAHYVKPGSALDVEAKRRGNSVYLVDRVIPMLPEKLSNGICSLNPDVERLTHAVVMEFDADGGRQKSRFTKAVIRSKRRLTYEEAFEILEAPRQKDDDVANGIHDAWELASQLRTRRFDNGSLDLDFPEVRVVLDENGKPVDLQLLTHDISHQLIEECMLAANEAVAEFIKNRGAPSVYRIHEDPDLDKLFEFRELARAYNYKVGDLTLRSEIQQLLRSIKGKTEEHTLKVGLLKSLKRAAYSENPLGHYGLAKVNYTHFTSPIRRYADLVVHRVLERLATRTDQKLQTPGLAELGDVSEHLSKTERTAANAENESKLLKQFEFFLNIAENEPRR
ncbi:MAG: VacB/RNase II family 3'-5' exoribonuclease, partial [Verrucomicrobiota bacterium]